MDDTSIVGDMRAVSACNRRAPRAALPTEPMTGRPVAQGRETGEGVSKVSKVKGAKRVLGTS